MILEALKDQRAAFGDELFADIKFSLDELQTESVADEPQEKKFEVAEKKEVIMENKFFDEDFQKAESISELDSLINQCTKCALSKSRNKFVFGAGNPNADIMLIGEAPGANEDKEGLPFVGRAGKLLTDILAAINFSRDEVYIANVLKCRPPKNRDPLPSEVEKCKPYLHKQIDLVKPKLILCLGRVAANNLLGMHETLTKLRDNIYELNNIKVMATFHPAALLRNPNWKRACWEDVQKFRKLYDEIMKKQGEEDN